MGCVPRKPEVSAIFSEPPDRLINTRSEKFDVSQDVVVAIHSEGHLAAWNLSSSEQLWNFSPPWWAWPNQTIIRPGHHHHLRIPGLSTTHGKFLSAVAFDGDFIISNFWENSLVHVWSLSQKKHLCTFEVDERLQCGPNLVDICGDFVVAVGDSQENRKNKLPAKVVVFSITQQKIVHRFDYPCDSSIICCTISKKYLIVSDGDGQVTVRDITNDYRPCKATINHDNKKGDERGSSPGILRIVGDILVTADTMQSEETRSTGGTTVMVWNLSKSMHMYTWKHDSIVVDVAARGNRAVTCCLVAVVLWDLYDGTRLRAIQVQKDEVIGVGISGDLSVFCCSTFQGPIRIWNNIAGGNVVEPLTSGCRDSDDVNVVGGDVVEPHPKKTPADDCSDSDDLYEICQGPIRMDKVEPHPKKKPSQRSNSDDLNEI